MLYIERELEKYVVMALRAIFKHDVEFTYIPPTTEGEEESKIKISSSWPNEKDKDINKKPRLIVDIQSLRVSEMSLGGNFAGDIMEEGVQKGKRYKAIIDFSATIICVSSSNTEAKTLSDKVFSYLNVVARDVLGGVGVRIKGIGKSGSSLSQQLPKETFNKQVMLNASTPWVAEAKYDVEYYKLVQNIKADMSIMDWQNEE